MRNLELRLMVYQKRLNGWVIKEGFHREDNKLHIYKKMNLLLKVIPDDLRYC
jgi:hypothetical protein